MNTSALTVGLALGSPVLSFGQGIDPKWANQLGLELYTIRDVIDEDKDFEGILAKVAAMGYKEVEPTNGYNNLSPKDWRATLERHGLSSPATHTGPTIGNDLEKQFEGFQVMGIKYSALPTPPRPGGPPHKGGAYLDGHNSYTQAEAFGPKQLPISLAEAQRRAAELNKYGKIGKKFGVKMLIHNHTGEFMPLTDSPNSTEYAVYLKETDPELVTMELDIGWATIAGQDIPALFRAHPGRFELWHVKDVFGVRNLNTKLPPVERISAVTFEPYGVGQIDYKPFFEMADVAGLQHFNVEQDNAASWGDSLSAAEVSAKNLKSLLTTGSVPGALYKKTDPYYRDASR